MGVRDCAFRIRRAIWSAFRSCAEPSADLCADQTDQESRSPDGGAVLSMSHVQQEATHKENGHEQHQKVGALGERLHAIIKASAPGLAPRLWYGMPAYAKDGKVVCFFQAAQKFKSRYATFGFVPAANLDEGDIWPTSFALKKLTADVEKTVGKLVKRAAS